MAGLQAFGAVDFDWTMHVESVWHDQDFHIHELHNSMRDEIVKDLESLKRRGRQNPLGRVVVGQAGSGKTHLLGSLRKEAAALGAHFVLIDMTDVRDFWETVLQGFLGSLFQSIDQEKKQFERVLERFVGKKLPVRERGRLDSLYVLGRLKPKGLSEIATRIIAALRRHDPHRALAHQDAIRALVLLASKDFALEDIGYCWLQGLEVEEKERRKLGFRSAAGKPMETVKALSWLMSLGAPTLLAFDQLDAIVMEHHLASAGGSLEELSPEQQASLAIIEGISGGLMALRDVTARTLMVVSCLERTWQILEKDTLRSATDRFRPPLHLKRINTKEVAEKIVELRLREGYARVGFQPPYGSYPFRLEAFEETTGMSPRQVLKLCDHHREKCLRLGRVIELTDFKVAKPSPPSKPISNRLDERLEHLKRQAKVADLLAERADDEQLNGLLQSACRCLLKEEDLPDDIDGVVDVEFPGAKTYQPLHARLRLIHRSQNDREKHYAFRALQRRNAVAFQNRLKAAMTAAGIDRDLGFRRLIILRTAPLPSGKVTQEVLRRFKKAGGIIHPLAEDEVRTLWAVATMERENHPELESWLRLRRPLCQLPLMQAARLCRGGGDKGQEKRRAEVQAAEKPATERSGLATIAEKGAGESAVEGKDAKPAVPAAQEGKTLPVGRRLIGDKPGEHLTLSLSDLTRHTVILAGSGSGKTVLVRRLVEEAALAGVPSVVIDGANDLARLGDCWPEPPTAWTAEDRKKAEYYQESAEVLVWTPGREAGNPLHLEILPDLAGIAEDADELSQTIDMVRQALQGTVAPGAAARARSKQGVLAAALKYFAHHDGGGLSELIALLSDLPSEAGGGISNSVKLAQEMADHLRAEMAINVLLRQSGTSLDPSILFGTEQRGRTRISVVNLIGLPGLEIQQQFVSQLAMLLFTWIKAHPAPDDAPVRGLLVIDEAKDFIPAGKSVPCKAALVRLAAQARKYGLGLIFASQAPKSIDHNVIANCTTHFYGKASSPAAIDAVREQLKQRGGVGSDIARLRTGQFYMHTEGMVAPAKLITPLCLSHHPSTPLDEAGVLKRAVDARDRLGCRSW